MRTLLSCFLITMLTFGLCINEASAKRFGGGRSFGMQRSQTSLFSSAKTQKTAPLNQRSKTQWGGMLGGLLIGGLLASLFMGNGLANGLITWLILGAALYFIVQFFRRRMHPGMQSATAPGSRQNPFSQYTQHESQGSGGTSVLANFDETRFLREAKVIFIRLQTAYDQKNLQDLKTFTVPEVFAEIKMQLDERGNEPNHTEIVTLETELLDASRQANSNVASVRFTGTLKENNEPLMQLDEIWHFRQFDGTNEWVVGGIQQDVNQPL
ncbi:MAG TPA: Tim44-like domain-containing protein [Legionella sp.]|nr:Tim44-like domain-containing protein [Legionella sp.]